MKFRVLVYEWPREVYTTKLQVLAIERMSVTFLSVSLAPKFLSCVTTGKSSKSLSHFCLYTKR